MVFWGSHEPGPGELRFAEPPWLDPDGCLVRMKVRHKPAKTRARIGRQPLHEGNDNVEDLEKEELWNEKDGYRGVPRSRRQHNDTGGNRALRIHDTRTLPRRFEKQKYLPREEKYCPLTPGCLMGVALGMALSGHPPHRSRRAALPHRAPTLGFDDKSFAWIRLCDSWLRQPFVDESLHSLPRHAAFATAPY